MTELTCVTLNIRFCAKKHSQSQCPIATGSGTEKIFKGRIFGGLEGFGWYVLEILPLKNPRKSIEKNV